MGCVVVMSEARTNAAQVIRANNLGMFDLHKVASCLDLTRYR